MYCYSAETKVVLYKTSLFLESVSYTVSGKVLPMVSFLAINDDKRQDGDRLFRIE